MSDFIGVWAACDSYGIISDGVLMKGIQIVFCDSVSTHIIDDETKDRVPGYFKIGEKFYMNSYWRPFIELLTDTPIVLVAK